MYKIWYLVDPRRALIGLALFLATLAFTIHFIMLSTDRFNWIEGPRAARGGVKAAQLAPLPPVVAEATTLSAPPAK